MTRAARRCARVGLAALAALATVVCAAKNPFQFSSAVYHNSPASPVVAVPAGDFLMGSTSAGPFVDEQPQRTVYLDAYAIEVTETTNVQYRACVYAGPCIDPLPSGPGGQNGYYTNPSYDDYPVVDVTWNMADQYCRWRGRRLPTEAEWEKAARGAADDRDYPWGWAEPTCDLADVANPLADSLAPDARVHETCYAFPVGVESYAASASPYGALNMTGNVAEWVADFYADDYYDAAAWPGNGVNPTGPPTGDEKVVRGGSYADTAIYTRVEYRDHHPPGATNITIGFRCAQDGSGR